VEKLDPKVISVDVEVAKERNPRMSDYCDRIELTCRSRGPVIRAEASADDPYAALDLAYNRLEARLRRAADRRRVHHGSRTPVSVASATAAVLSANGDQPGISALGTESAAEPLTDEGPMVIREKVHQAKPMNLDQALYEMELVGHDFFLFVDADSGNPSVVYRRRAYDYGVIRLAV
jgi:ribosomal subunit interface protein